MQLVLFLLRMLATTVLTLPPRPVCCRLHLSLGARPRTRQLLAGLTDEEKAQLHLTADISELNLLNQSGCTTLTSVDDAAELRRTRRAMEAMAMGDAEQAQMTKALSAVLQLAQLAFELTKEAEGRGEERSQVAGSSAALLEQVSSLLGIEHSEELSNALCTRLLVTRDDMITVPLNLEQARPY